MCGSLARGAGFFWSASGVVGWLSRSGWAVRPIDSDGALPLHPEDFLRRKEEAMWSGLS